MVRIINIDTKTHTIRVSNGKDDLEWFTTDTGSHVPLKKGQSKAEAIKEHFGDKKQNPQLERLEKMGKAWGKDQMSVLRELGKRNPQGLKDELDRIDAEHERITKAHKEWLKEKADKQQPAKKVKETYADTSEIDGAEVFKDGDDYVVLYANGTKTREFSSKTEADKFAKSLSKQPAKQDKGIEEEYLAEINRLEQKSQRLRKMGQGRSATKIDEQVFKLQKELAKAMGYGGTKAKSEPAARDVMKESATDWYAKAFKSDKKMAPKNGVTFEQLYESLKKGENIYDKMGVGDSIVRERVMSEMADRLGVDYDHVYDLWLNGGEKGSESRKKNQEESIALMDKLLKQANIDPGVKKAIVAARKRAKQDIQ